MKKKIWRYWLGRKQEAELGVWWYNDNGMEDTASAAFARLNLKWCKFWMELFS